MIASANFHACLYDLWSVEERVCATSIPINQTLETRPEGDTELVYGYCQVRMHSAVCVVFMFEHCIV